MGWKEVAPQVGGSPATEARARAARMGAGLGAEVEAWRAVQLVAPVERAEGGVAEAVVAPLVAGEEVVHLVVALTEVGKKAAHSAV